MEYIKKEELLKRLEKKYGNLENECGCYINGRWISVANIVDIVEKCEEYNY